MNEQGGKVQWCYSILRAAAIVACLFYVGCKQHKQPNVQPQNAEKTVVTVYSSLLTSKNPPVQIALSSVPAPLKKYAPVPATKILRQFTDSLTGVAVPEDAQGKGLFTTYTTDEGLALDQVYCSYKDHNGNLWFGTSGGGVSKYDGRSFTNYNKLHGLANNVIWSVLEDKKGNLWFGTDGNGVSKYDGKNFTNYTTKTGLANDVVYGIKEDNYGNLWFATLKGGVSKYDGKVFTNYTTSNGLAANAVRDLAQDDKGSMWFATLGGGVSKFDGNRFVNYSSVNGLSGDTIRCICKDAKGNIWMGVAPGYLNKFDGQKFTTYTTKDGLSGYDISSLIEDKDGNIWLGTKGGGAQKFNGSRFTTYTTAQGLISNNIRCITEDDKGGIWFGTFGGGVSRFVGKSFSNFSIAQGLSANIVYSITQDSAGALWLGTFGGGICKYDGKSFVSYETPEGIANNLVYCTAKDNTGNLWFGTFEGGLVKYDGKTYTNYTTSQGLASNIVFCIKQDRKGNLWFGTSGGGVSMYDGRQFTNYTKAQGLPDNEIFCITEDKAGNLWFGSSGAGVSVYNGKCFTNIGKAQGLPDEVVWAITEDTQGAIWIGTQQGLSMITKTVAAKLAAANAPQTTFDAPILQTYTTADGLPDNFITQVLQGDSNKLYVGTNLGICEMLQRKATANQDKKWYPGKIFNSATGFPVKDVNAGLGALYKDRKGIIWIGTGSDKTGLVRFDPQIDNARVAKQPVLVIQSVKINQEKLVWGNLPQSGNATNASKDSSASGLVEEINTFGHLLTHEERDSLRQKYRNVRFDSIRNWYPVPEKLVLPNDNNSISFDFNAIETSNNDRVLYQFMLQGYDKQWSPPASVTTATFGNMFEGEYTFAVRAKAPEGTWGKPVTYTFKVLPPWWRTWWMYVLYVAAICAFVLLFSRWNNKRIIQQKHVLEEKVAHATAEIRQEKENVEAQKKLVEGTLKDLKSTQAQLIQAEKMASLGELTAGIAHEIQNPLNFVNNFSEVSIDLVKEMNEELARGEFEEAKFIAADIEQNLEKIYHHGKRAESIVSGMLEHSRTSSGHKVPTDINKLTDEFLRLAYHGIRAKDKSFNSDIVTDFDAALEKIDIIPQDMGRVILNLVTNAFHAVNEKAKSGISDYKPAVTAATRRLEDHVELTISDNGNGIPDRIRPKIFQPFFTTKPTGQGTGLGLSLSYDIVKAHEGEIEVTTSSETGTSFKVIIPV